MPWLKKNLWWVGSAAVALVLLVIAGAYLYRNFRAESLVSAELNQQTEELNQLNNLNPHPGTDKVNNIEAAKQQEKELEAFLLEAQKRFVPLDYPTNLDSGQFKLLLDTTIDELQRQAERASVKLHPNYAFSFSSQKSLLFFEPNTIPPMTRMLLDIKTISEMLFRAKVLALDGIRRPSVTAADTPTPGAQPGMSDFWTKKAVTNDLAIMTPYEFTFHCFTPELASVLEQVYSSPHCFLVKNLVVDPAPSQLLEKPADQNSQTMPVGPAMPYMNYRYLQQMLRYGIMPRGYAPITPPPETPSTTPSRGGLQVVLDEKPFRVIMWVEAVIVKSLEEVKARKKAPAPRPRPAEAPADGSTPSGESTPATEASTPAATGGGTTESTSAN
jgi:hypothetical protein